MVKNNNNVLMEKLNKIPIKDDWCEVKFKRGKEL